MYPNKKLSPAETPPPQAHTPLIDFQSWHLYTYIPVLYMNMSFQKQKSRQLDINEITLRSLYYTGEYLIKAAEFLNKHWMVIVFGLVDLVSLIYLIRNAESIDFSVLINAYSYL